MDRFTEFTVINQDVPLYCRRYGSSDAPESVLMIHGAGVGCDFFDEVASLLAKQYQVILYDRRGYSRTPLSADGSMSAQSHASDAAAILRTMDGPVHIIAHSAGCIVTQELLVEYFSEFCIRSILLYEPVNFIGSPFHDEFVEIKQLVKEGKFSKALTRMLATLGDPDPRSPQLTETEHAFQHQNLHNSLEHDQEMVFYEAPYEKLQGLPIAVGIGEGSLSTIRAGDFQHLAEKLHCPILAFPGVHNCPRDLPMAFACLAAGYMTLFRS